ncbi:MAG: ATP-dependent RecD-like DNA helicase [Bacilli bacterium]|nr:ATP-dependent RecD-like DNA helicase [Bacilli bacterium]
MKTTVKGIYRRSIFVSEKGYHIGIMKVKETNDEDLQDLIGSSLTFTGYFHELEIDDLYEFEGEIVDHPKYGFQYEVSHYERVKPTDKEGIVLFLSSDLFKGIGEKQATKIVDVLGSDAIDKILKDPNCLNKVTGLTKKKKEVVYESLVKHEESSATIVYLTDLGFSMRDALLIYNTYKGNTIMKIEHNIYSLIEDIEEISFPKIDKIALKIESPKEAPERIKACILYMMKEHSFNTGDTYASKEILYTKVTSYTHFFIEEEDFIQYLKELQIDYKIVIEEEAYYLYDVYEAERKIAYTLYKLLHKEKKQYKKMSTYIEMLEKDYSILYNDKQKEAITEALQNNVFVITGGPGTGKTTIIKAILEIYGKLHKLEGEALFKEVALLAPTGRASKRMSESTFFPSSTIHRFLKWNKETGDFAINEMDPSDCKLVIVDEVSMIDTVLFYNLLMGFREDIKLVLVGDFHQLPSVGPGQVLKDLIESDVIPKTELNLLYRQDQNSHIPLLAQEIKEGELTDFKEPKEDYQFLDCRASTLPANLKKICKQIIDKGYDYKKLQLMAPMYKGPCGIDALNAALQEVFNPKEEDKEQIELEGVVFREHDKVLQLVNMPEENIFNGDIGVISKIIKASHSPSKKNEIYIDFDGNEVLYFPKDMYKIRHGFIISIHKSQGSEFDFVILPMVQSYHRMLYRKLIYTAVTRAKKKLILIGEEEALIYSVSHNAEYIRKTKFKEKLQNICIKS